MADDKCRCGKVYEAVFGNGNPENSIMVRVSTIEKACRTQGKRTARIEKYILSIMGGLLIFFTSRFVRDIDAGIQNARASAANATSLSTGNNPE